MSIAGRIIGKLLTGLRWDEKTIPEYVSNDMLCPDMIPARGASWDEISAFSLSFNGYRKEGSFNRCAEVPCSPRCETLSEMREFLFHELKRWNSLKRAPEIEELTSLYDLLDRMRDKVARGQRE
ncbi:hypothetical protein EG829_15615 [bacterium]|nr:hypothetical protein [bacterium]